MGETTNRLTLAQSVALAHMRARPRMAGYTHGSKMNMLYRLKDRGLCEVSPRGHWVLTEAGAALIEKDNNHG